MLRSRLASELARIDRRSSRARSTSSSARTAQHANGMARRSFVRANSFPKRSLVAVSLSRASLSRERRDSRVEEHATRVSESIAASNRRPARACGVQSHRLVIVVSRAPSFVVRRRLDANARVDVGARARAREMWMRARRRRARVRARARQRGEGRGRARREVVGGRDDGGSVDDDDDDGARGRRGRARAPGTPPRLETTPSVSRRCCACERRRRCGTWDGRRR